MDAWIAPYGDRQAAAPVHAIARRGTRRDLGLEGAVVVGGNWIRVRGFNAGGSVVGSTARAASMAPRAFRRRLAVRLPKQSPEQRWSTPL